jgi:glyoxylase-like metal-dependent hydrolase (beta-lactamase superfamily II)
MESPREYYQALCDGPPLKLARGLYQLTIPLPFRLNHVHTYLVEAEGGFILIDTGVNTAEAFAALKRKLHDMGLDFGDIGQVVVTHFHSDHCGQVAHIHDLGRARVVMGDAERATWEDVQAGVDDRREELFRQHGLPPEQATEHAGVLPYLKSLSLPFEVDLRIGQGHTLLAKHRRLEAFVTPGHTPGHVCLFLPEEKLMFSGDHILQKITPNIGLHQYSGPDPLGDYLQSLRATLTLGATRLLPSHGPPVDHPETRIHELLRHHEQRLQGCVEALGSTPLTAYEVSLQLFGTSLDHFGRWMAMGETLAHLEHLVHQGRVARGDEGGQLRYRRT